MTCRRVDIEQNRLTHRNQGSTENTLQQAEDHQLAKVRSDPTQPRCKGEANDRELDEPLTAETPCQPAGERRTDGGSNAVGGQHPGARQSVVSGQSVSVRVDLGGRRIIKKKLILYLIHLL